MLRPIIRILLRNGMTYKEYSQYSKMIFVDVATSDYRIRNRPTNISRIAIMTGLSRREVTRLRADLAQEDTTDVAKVDRASRVLAGWHNDPEFLDSSGKPLALTESSGAPSFAQLFARYGGDVPMSAMLKELLKTGAVEAQANGKLLAKQQFYMPQQSDPVALERSATVFEDVGSTVFYNLYRGEHDRSAFEGRATNNNIPVSDVSKFQDYLEKSAQEFLSDSDRWLSTCEQEGGPRNEETVRLGVGLYLIKD